jgi:hypothetical protein
VVELADVFRRYGPAYRQKYGTRLLPSHRQAMHAIEQCRTAALGGQVFYCQQCEEAQYSYHSCRNRHCPKCQQQAAETWLARHQQLRLPVPYFLLTFTLPAALRDLARRQQKCVYQLLFRASAAATQELARDPRFVGGQIGMIGILHTWARDLSYHPHVHYLVPGGGLAEDHWRSAKPDFLVHVRPLAVLFRAKLRAALRQTELYDQVPAAVWQQDWVVHCLPVGDGQAALKYLAPYIFRVALCNRRILQAEDGQVTFQYTDRESGASRHCTLAAEAFIQRFLQHVLPKGFVKVRYYGFFSSGNRPRLRHIRQLLGAHSVPLPQQADLTKDVRRCPACGGVMHWLEQLAPIRKRPP